MHWHRRFLRSRYQWIGRVSLHIFRLFVVLVEPPPDLIPGAGNEGMHDYLTQLL